MIASQVKDIVDKAVDLGLEDYIVVSTDNEYNVQHRSQTSAGAFDHDKGLFWAFRTNNNPTRNVVGRENQFLLEAFDYEHIVEIYIQVPKEKAIEAIAAASINAAAGKKVFEVRVGEFSAQNWNTKPEDYVPSTPANMSGVIVD